MPLKTEWWHTYGSVWWRVNRISIMHIKHNVHYILSISMEYKKQTNGWIVRWTIKLQSSSDLVMVKAVWLMIEYTPILMIWIRIDQTLQKKRSSWSNHLILINRSHKAFPRHSLPLSFVLDIPHRMCAHVDDTRIVLFRMPDSSASSA